MYTQYAIVTLENGDKFAVRGELEDNLVDLRVDKRKNSITPYYIEFGSEEEAEEAHKHYLEVGVIRDLKIPDFANINFYEIVEEYECAIADAIIYYSKLHNGDTAIKFISPV